MNTRSKISNKFYDPVLISDTSFKDKFLGGGRRDAVDLNILARLKHAKDKTDTVN